MSAKRHITNQNISLPVLSSTHSASESQYISSVNNPFNNQYYNSHGNVSNSVLCTNCNAHDKQYLRYIPREKYIKMQRSYMEKLFICNNEIQRLKNEIVELKCNQVDTRNLIQQEEIRDNVIINNVDTRNQNIHNISKDTIVDVTCDSGSCVVAYGGANRNTNDSECNGLNTVNGNLSHINTNLPNKLNNLKLRRSRSVSPFLKKGNNIKKNISRRSSSVDNYNSNSIKNQLELVTNVNHFKKSYKCLKYISLHTHKNVSSFLHANRHQIIGTIQKERNNHPYNRFQLDIKLQLVKLSENNELAYNDFHLTSRVQYVNNAPLEQILHEIENQLLERETRILLQDSGWSLNRVHNVSLCFYETGMKIKKIHAFGEYASWPKNARGSKSVINIKTQHSCVELSCIAHFLYQKCKKEKKTLKRMQEPDTYSKYRNKFFKFPFRSDQKISIEQFNKIEKSTDTSISLYHIYEIGSESYIRLLRRGKNNKVSKERKINLIKICNSNHVALIKNWNLFIATVTLSNSNSGKDSHRYCNFCFAGMHHSKIDNHIDFCGKLDCNARIVMPEVNSKVKFSRFESLTKKKFICYLDYEAYLPKSDKNNILHEHKVCAYKYVIINKHGDVVKSQIRFGEGVTLSQNCLSDMYNDYENLMVEYEKTSCNTLSLTEQDKVKFKRAEVCEVCDKKFRNSTDKHRYYDRDMQPVYDDYGNITTGNYIAALCFQCNISISHKHRLLLTVVTQNFSKYNSKFVIAGITDDIFQPPEILTQSRKCIISLKLLRKTKVLSRTLGFHFIDPFNFLSSSLDKLSETLIQDNDMRLLPQQLNKLGYNDRIIELSMQKGLFSYEYITSIESLQQECLPAIEEFYRKHNGKNITNEEYSRANEVCKEGKCETLKDYLLLSLNVDVLLLAEVFEAFRRTSINHHQIDPAHYVSLPEYSFSAALLKDKTKIELLTSNEVYTIFENGIRGGFTTTVKPYKKFNNLHSPNYNPDDSISSGILLNFNSLYSEMMATKLPISGFHEFNDEEIKSFDISSYDENGEYSYALIVDYSIPDDVKRLTDDLPLALHKKMANYTELSQYTQNLISLANGKEHFDKKRVPKLMATHERQTNYLISIHFLKLLIELGIHLEKIHRVFRFKQSAFYKSFIETNVELEKNSTNEFERNLYKLCNNVIFEDSHLNCRNYSEKVHLTTSQRQFKRHASSPLLKHCYPVADNQVLLISEQDSISLNSPIFIGFFILEKTKVKMYNFFYHVLKKHFNNQIDLVYSDTNSLLLSFEGVKDMFQEIKQYPLKDYIDTSNFNKNHELYSTRHKDVLGMLKSETAENLPYEVIAPGPKCYSMLLNDSNSVKQAAKGVKHDMTKLLTHDIYRDIHNQTKLNFKINIVNIRPKKLHNATVIESRNALTKVEDTRFYLDSNKSLGYSHPDIPIENGSGDSIRNCINICNANRITSIIKHIENTFTSYTDNQLNSNSQKRKQYETIFS